MGHKWTFGNLRLDKKWPYGKYPAMQQTSIIDEVNDYCARAGIQPSTLAVRVLGNSRFFGRLERRLEKAAQDADSLRAYMAANPPRAPDQTQGAA